MESEELNKHQRSLNENFVPFLGFLPEGNSSCIWRYVLNRQCAFPCWCLVNESIMNLELGK